jgi:cobalt-zinc-cadmium efflux system outer membrane protein
MRRLSLGLLIAVCLTRGVRAQKAFTWQEIRDKFEAENPTLRAGQLSVDEAKAQEMTAWLRPNPDLTTTLDQFDPFTPNPYRPLANTLPLISAAQAGIAPRERPKGHRHRGLATSRPG